MAVFNFDEQGSAYSRAYGNRNGSLVDAQRWVSIGGAVSSVALVLGLAYWGYALAVRDVAGVPVMRAATGVMRVAPADPGGVQALNQGLTVNAVAAMGTSAKSADTVTLAPLAVALQPDDVPVVPVDGTLDQTANGQIPMLGTGAISATAVEATATVPEPMLTQDSVDAAVAAALAEASGETAVPAASPTLRPMPRPVELGGTAVPADDIATKGMAVLEKAPSAIMAGTILAQFGAFETPETARARFGDLVQNFDGLMAGKSMVVQQVETNGRMVYRLRVEGFANEAEANSFCAALQAEGVECVPVAQR